MSREQLVALLLEQALIVRNHSEILALLLKRNDELRAEIQRLKQPHQMVVKLLQPFLQIGPRRIPPLSTQYVARSAVVRSYATGQSRRTRSRPPAITAQTVGDNCLEALKVAVGKSSYDVLLEDLRESAYVHGDETGWFEGGQNVYLWSFSNPTSVTLPIQRPVPVMW